MYLDATRHSYHLFFMSFENILAAFYNDIVVGAVCCRVDVSENSRKLYIMTLGCLAPYRRLGIGKFASEMLFLFEHKKIYYCVFLL